MLLGLIYRWRKENLRDTSERDLLLLACCLIVASSTELFDAQTQAAFAEACKGMESGGEQWFDYSIWAILEAIVTDSPARDGRMDRLYVLLDFHDSALRLWFHRVAWMLRPLLDRHLAAPYLLQNIADKIGYVQQSAGLLANMYEDREELEAVVSSYEPTAMADQYARTVKNIEGVGWYACGTSLWREERRAWQLVWAEASALRF